MSQKNLISPVRAFLLGLAALLYAAVTLAVLGGVAPAMVSSSDDILVVSGFALATAWLLATGCIALHITNRIRASAEQSTPKENHQ